MLNKIYQEFKSLLSSTPKKQKIALLVLVLGAPLVFFFYAKDVCRASSALGIPIMWLWLLIGIGLLIPLSIANANLWSKFKIGGDKEALKRSWYIVFISFFLITVFAIVGLLLEYLC